MAIMRCTALILNSVSMFFESWRTVYMSRCPDFRVTLCIKRKKVCECKVDALQAAHENNNYSSRS